MNKVFSVIGGDIRFIRVAERLAEQGFLVLTAGLGEDLKESGIYEIEVLYTINFS